MFARRFATIVACLKILFGGVELVTGLLWLFVTPSGVQHQIQRLVDWMASQQPDNPAVEMLQRQLPALFAHGTLVALLPFDVRSAAADGSPFAWLFVALDLVILAALLWFRGALTGPAAELAPATAPDTLP